MAYSGSLRIKNYIKFIRLNFPTKGYYYNNAALTSQAVFTCGDANAQACYNDSKILACKNNYFWYKNSGGAQSCVQRCTGVFPRYLLYKGSPSSASSASTNSNTGFCNADCHDSTTGQITCPSSSTDLIPAGYGSGLTCNGSNYSIYSFFCIQTDLKFGGSVTATDPNTGALLYSQKFNSPTIEINISPALTLYHFEVWYLPDLIWQGSTTGSKYYVLWTNSVRVKKDNKGLSYINDYKVYLGDTVSAVIPGGSSKIEYKYNEWQKVGYSVVANSANAGNFDINYYYINSSSNDYISSNIASGTSLTKIAFCTNNCLSYFSDGYWSSGAYKLLKVWDATSFSIDLYKGLDK